MVANNNLLIISIISILLQCTSYTHSDCVTRTYRRFPKNLNVLKNKVFYKGKNIDITECAQWCADEDFCKMWKLVKGICKIYHSMKEKLHVKSAKKVTIYYETEQDEKWIKIFFVKNGTGINVASSFLNWGYSNCTQDRCPGFFRSSLIDVWTKLPITEVKLSLIKNNREVRYLIFDGQNTDSKSWFSMSRVSKSPWKDVHKGVNNSNFGIDGNFGKSFACLRSFYAYHSHNGCANDLGWILVVEPKSQSICDWEKHKTYPQIMFSSKDSVTKWAKEYDVAEALAIYISF